MKLKTFVLFGVLSLLVGTAFASPLLVSELEIRPFRAPLPKGTTADIGVNVVYANFTTGDTTLSEIYNKNVTDFSFFVVLNITNNSDEPAIVRMINFDAAEKITKGASNSVLFSGNWTSIHGWESKGAWVDGVFYNLTWISDDYLVSGTSVIFGETPVVESPPSDEGYWMEGVKLRDKAVGGNVTNMYIYMNGTWVDVTGRITWLDNDGNIVDINPERLPEHASDAVTCSGMYFGEQLTLGANRTNSDDDLNTDPGLTARFFAPIEFNNCWEPHQSRLIALYGNKQVFTGLLNLSRFEQLETEPVTLRGSIHSELMDAIGVYDSQSVDDEIKQVMFEAAENGYLYNTILTADKTFVLDTFGVEVFIESRN
jgi:predicted lactoylglutathione lyase